MIREDWGLTPYQIGLLTVALIGGTSVIVMPSILAAYAGQTSWLSALLPVPVGLVPLALWYDLDRRRPGLTLIEHAEAALGRAGGLPFAIALVVLSGTVCAAVLRQFSDLISAEALPRTPEVVVLGLMLLVPVYAVRQGPEVIARVGEVLVPISILAIVLVGVVGLKDVTYNNLRPFLAQGPAPVLQGALVAAPWYAETALLALLLPFRGCSRRKAAVGAVAGLALAGVLTAFVTAWTVAVFGPLSAHVTFAVFQVTRVASVAEFFTHIDSLLVVVWVAAGFGKTAVWLYALCFSAAQMAGCADYRPLTLPMGGLVIAAAMTWWASGPALTAFVMHDWVFWGLLLELAVPLAIWIAAAIRGRPPRRYRIARPVSAERG